MADDALPKLMPREKSALGVSEAGGMGRPRWEAGVARRRMTSHGREGYEGRRWRGTQASMRVGHSSSKVCIESGRSGGGERGIEVGRTRMNEFNERIQAVIVDQVNRESSREERMG